MKKTFKYILSSVFLIAFLILPILTLAGSSASDNLNKVGSGLTSDAPYAKADEYKLSDIIGVVIQTFLGLLGVLFLVYMLYAGYNWMIAQGDEEKVTKAKDTIQRAVIGLIIVIAAYAMSFWVFDKLLTRTGIVSQ
ncbi:MAG: hypothetical protein Q7K35_02795 [bacterium]|nr:hypothetical protein [bacterium]